MSRENRDSEVFSLLLGLVAGLFGGALLGLLFAPKSGDELRADVHGFVRELPDKLNNEFKNPNTKTREFIQRTRYNIENQVGKVRDDRAAERMARAKEAEELASGYEFH